MTPPMTSQQTWTVVLKMLRDAETCLKHAGQEVAQQSPRGGSLILASLAPVEMALRASIIFLDGVKGTVVKDDSESN